MPQCDDGDLAGHPPHPGPTPVGGITLGTWHPEFQACRSLTAAGAGPQLAACAWRKLGHEFGVSHGIAPSSFFQLSSDRDLFATGDVPCLEGLWKGHWLPPARASMQSPDRSYAPSDHCQPSEQAHRLINRASCDSDSASQQLSGTFECHPFLCLAANTGITIFHAPLRDNPALPRPDTT